MKNNKNNFFAKIVLLVLIINFFNFIFDNYLENKNDIFASTLQKLFVWPLNQLPKENITYQEKSAQNLFSTINIPAPEATKTLPIYESKVDYEQRIINAVKATDKSVVSIVALKDLPVLKGYQINPMDLFGDNPLDPFNFYFQSPKQQSPQQEQKYEKQEIASGSGFVITHDGYIVTNKHVISKKDAEYMIFLNDGSQHKGTVVAVDPHEDFGLIKIEKQGLVPLTLGNSDSLQLGQSVIAIGNALGEFKNTISVGVVSGLNRNIVASGGNLKTEKLSNLIQTDAAINRGNSGGPLLNLNGEVIGINTATVVSAQNIGFAIPINKIKNTISQALKTGKITVPYIGVYYIQLNKNEIAKRALNVEYGALLITEGKNSAILKDSPAEKSGLLDNDIILSINNEKVTDENPLISIIRKYNPGTNIIIEIKRDDKILKINLVLGEK